MKAFESGDDGLRWDGFVSYSSADHRFAARIQTLLQSFRRGREQSRLRIFLDKTDIRGGEVGETLASELRASRKLILCASPSAGESAWVDHELALFRECRGDANVAIVLIAGAPEATVPPAASGGVYRWHDVRTWRWWWPFGRSRLEMLRLLAFIADIELRSIVNWDRRRLLARSSAVVLGLLTLLIGVASYPVTHWQRIELGSSGISSVRNESIRPIACEIRTEKIWTAARIRQNYTLGFRNYIVQFSDALKPSHYLSAWANGPVAPYRVERRLLPTWRYSR